MKKIAVFVLTFVFAAAFGVAYAGEAGNGITVFNGKSIDTLTDLYPAASDPMPNVVEGSNAGGLRAVDLGIEEMNNGVTDFTGRSIDTTADLGAAFAGVKSHTLMKSAPVRAGVYDFGKPLTN